MEVNVTSKEVISLTSDFGLKDPYVAEMKGTILSICPNAAFVDITHSVEKFNVQEGAFALASAAPFFPAGTIHLAVVDPGVGTNRRPIIVQTEQSLFVGPDNGLLILAAKAQGIRQTRQIQSRRFNLSHVSPTFHGRDIFAPAAAHLAKGVEMEEFGPQVTDFVEPEFVRITKSKDKIIGLVLHIDDFGNIITNIHTKSLSSFRDAVVEIEIDSQTQQMRLSNTYADVKPKETVALIGSHNYLEIALNQGSAAAKFSVKVGRKITLSRI